mmetsp:Transcript_37580/g.62231  ORF Transcript_37580/g.62231 Transcript_37580/m.62231 type:complete len:254 (+) Transcript_37580:105-866(+)|eukprot:CAMPEP_0119342300 /NCGR_PEP_ID=MMETSP1333-20130426/104428_1 /TAXON_ID=418940 /ORGANISM="Scyphosphaera apsteinii, Strain RCC1455" /LENGTH=253 /DNA_ID=CAMNT_0007354487 /DNA_START=98 /DNA_END=859 /DNA_ORIENTATION=+
MYAFVVSLLTLRHSFRCIGNRANRCVAVAENAWELIVQELNAVPIWAVETDGKLYSQQGTVFAYTQLTDSQTILQQLRGTYPDASFSLQPIGLGTLLQQGGLLGDDSVRSISTKLVGSPAERQAARSLMIGPHPNPVGTASVPVFHLGPLAWRTPNDEEQLRWPLFFRFCDVQATWSAIGGGAPMPTVETLTLHALLSMLRSVSRSLPGQPIFCPPLDGLEFMQKEGMRLRELAGMPISNQGMIDVTDTTLEG